MEVHVRRQRERGFMHHLGPVGRGDVAAVGQDLGVIALPPGRERGLDLVGLGVDQREVGQQLQAVLARGAGGALQRRERIGEIDAGDHAEQHIVGVVELAFFDARDHVGDLGLRLGRGHLAALHLVQHLLGLGRPGLAGVKALALHEAEIGALENRALDGVGVAAKLTLLDIAVAAGHIAAAGLLGRLHRMLARAAKHAVAAAALRAHLAAALVVADHEVLGHALCVGQVGDGDLRGGVLLRPGRAAPGQGGDGQHGEGGAEGGSALHGVDSGGAAQRLLVLRISFSSCHSIVPSCTSNSLSVNLQYTSLVALLCLTMLVNSPSMLYLAAVIWPILAVLPCRYRPLWFWRCNSSTPCCISLMERAKRTLPDLTSAVCIEFITLVVSMYSLVLFFTVEIVTVGRPWKMPVSSSPPVIFSAIICRSVEPNSLVTNSTALASP